MHGVIYCLLLSAPIWIFDCFTVCTYPSLVINLWYYLGLHKIVRMHVSIFSNTYQKSGSFGITLWYSFCLFFVICRNWTHFSMTREITKAYPLNFVVDSLATSGMLIIIVLLCFIVVLLNLCHWILLIGTSVTQGSNNFNHKPWSYSLSFDSLHLWNIRSIILYLLLTEYFLPNHRYECDCFLYILKLQPTSIENTIRRGHFCSLTGKNSFVIVQQLLRAMGYLGSWKIFDFLFTVLSPFSRMRIL